LVPQELQVWMQMSGRRKAKIDPVKGRQLNTSFPGRFQ
jgi:hypothetical protein